MKTISIALLIVPGFLSVAQVSDPVPGVPVLNGITLQIENYVRIPASSNITPRARINHVKPMNDSQSRLMVNDLNGPFHVISNGVVSLYANLDDMFSAFTYSPGLGTGFGSFAFHPDFANNGKIYTSHSEKPGSGTPDFPTPVKGSPVALQGVITEWTATDPSAAEFSGTIRELLRIDLVHTIHGMQEIAFNPNAGSDDPDYGMLYICIGDSGSTIRGYPLNNHRLDSVLGTILRIDSAGTNSPNGQYGIPEDNPWAGDGDPSTFDELWAFGFRNPHRISWDTQGDGKMLSGEIGEGNIEEINWIEPGRDYGWNMREGTFVINSDWVNNPQNGGNNEVFPLPAADGGLGFTYPVVQYDHDQGFAVVGGYVYRGVLANALFGKYIFGDIRNGKLYVTDADSLVQNTQSEFQEVELELGGSKVTMLQLAGGSRADLRFGIDDNNELYLLEKRQGKIFKVIGAKDNSRSPNAGGRLINISTRGKVQTGDDFLIGGFVIGEDSQRVLIQALGPELNRAGVADTLVDPVLKVFDSEENLVIDNDDWEEDGEQASTIKAVWGTSLPLDEGSSSSAVVITLPQGSYTAVVSGIGGTQGVALVEVYKVD